MLSLQAGTSHDNSFTFLCWDTTPSPHSTVRSRAVKHSFPLFAKHSPTSVSSCLSPSPWDHQEGRLGDQGLASLDGWVPQLLTRCSRQPLLRSAGSPPARLTYLRVQCNWGLIRSCLAPLVPANEAYSRLSPPGQPIIRFIYSENFLSRCVPRAVCMHAKSIT